MSFIGILIFMIGAISFVILSICFSKLVIASEVRGEEVNLKFLYDFTPESAEYKTVILFWRATKVWLFNVFIFFAFLQPYGYGFVDG